VRALPKTAFRILLALWAGAGGLPAAECGGEGFGGIPPAGRGPD
jgi:hypothetical protein